MPLDDGWDVAHLVMHSAFDELEYAHELCQQILTIDLDTLSAQECFFESINVAVAIHNNVVMQRTPKAVVCEAVRAFWETQKAGAAL